MMGPILIRTILLAPMLILAWLPATAQGDLESERASLEGVAAFQVAVTIEGPAHIAQSETLAAEVVSERVTGRLREAGLRVVSRSEDEPRLHIHVNAMEMGDGLVPFSIELSFLQEVALVRTGREMRAETWNESVVGLVSQDMIPAIGEAVDGLVDQFIQDFQSVQ